MATPRVRFQSTPNAPATYYTAGPTLGSLSTTHQKLDAFKQRTEDVVIPHFKAQSALGKIFNNPLYTEKSWYASTGGFHAEFWAYGLDARPSYPDTTRGFNTVDYANGRHMDALVPFLPDPEFASLQETLLNQARTQASANVNKTDIMALVTFAEWHKTKGLHRDVGVAILNMVKAVYSKNPGRALARAVSDAWMLGRYGIIPSVYELQGALKLLTKPVHERYTARGQAVDMIEVSDVMGANGLSDNWYYATIARRTTVELTARAGILYELAGSDLELQRFLGGAGLTRPLTTVWELVPFSWMVDWWVDVGMWLDAIQPDGASQYLSAWVTERVRITRAAVVTGFAPLPASDFRWSKDRTCTGSKSHIYETVNRRPYNGDPPPLPPKGRGLNNVRIADFIAVVTQKLRLSSGGAIRGVRF